MNAINPDIISAVITASGTIIAAFIVALIGKFSAEDIVRKNNLAKSYTYGNKDSILPKILSGTKKDIVIVAAVGNFLFERYAPYLESLLRRGIHIRCLLLTEEKLAESDLYIHGKETPDVQRQNRRDSLRRKAVVNQLAIWTTAYPNLVDCKEFDLRMTASYIGADIWSGSSDAVIQVMPYLYKTEGKFSPIHTISPQTDKENYDAIVQCIKNMWNDDAHAHTIPMQQSSPRVDESGR